MMQKVSYFFFSCILILCVSAINNIYGREVPNPSEGGAPFPFKTIHNIKIFVTL